jgi:hypothetical protein
MGKSAYESNRQVGERMVQDEVVWLGNKAKELLGAYDTEKPTVKLRTFEDVEHFWDKVVRPKIKDFKTMKKSWSKDQELPESSVWNANWRIPDRN